MANQKGVVLVFKPGTTQEEIKKILEYIRDKLEGSPVIHDFNPKWGHPVFYVP